MNSDYRDLLTNIDIKDVVRRYGFGEIEYNDASNMLCGLGVSHEDAVELLAA